MPHVKQRLTSFLKDKCTSISEIFQRTFVANFIINQLIVPKTFYEPTAMKELFFDLGDTIHGTSLVLHFPHTNHYVSNLIFKEDENY